MKVSALIEIRYFDGRPPSLCARLETAESFMDLPITLEQAALLLQNGVASPEEADDDEEAELPSPAKVQKRTVKLKTAPPMARVELDDDEDEDDDL